MFTTFILFFGGLMIVGFIFFSGRGGGSCRFPSENRIKHHNRTRKIEQEVQKVRDRALLWGVPR